MQVQALYENAHIEAYGSVASNLPMQDSDVDLCVVFDDVEVCLHLSQHRCRFVFALEHRFIFAREP